MPDPMPKERRKYSRIAFSAPAKLLIGEQTLEAAILDLSLKGALIELAAGTVPDQAACSLRIGFDGEPAEEVAMEARVVRVAGRRAALLCLSMDLDSITHLRRLVEFNLGSQALLEREFSMLAGGSPTV